MKVCCTCKIEKDLDQFNKNQKRKDGLASACRACHKIYVKHHYEKNKARYHERANQHDIKQKLKLIEILKDLKSKPCKDCGKTFPSYAMDFDHLDASQKEFDVAAGVQMRVSEQRFLAEIAKCELVCAVCHRIRTHNRRCVK